jgi:dTDP-glucose 4,6-dehydratase
VSSVDRGRGCEYIRLREPPVLLSPLLPLCVKVILVTGAAGFVARTFLPFLADAGWRNLVLVDRNPIDPDLLRSLQARGAQVRVFMGDSLPPVEVEIAVCLAGSTSVDAALRDPSPAIEGNLKIANDLGEWARRHRTPLRVLYMSSDEVLGASDIPLDEGAPLKPTQPYAASKAGAEIVLRTYADVYGFRLVIVRSCNLVGAGQREPKLIPVAVRHLLSGAPVPIHGSGEQMREWMAVEDLCRAIMRLMDETVPPRVYQAASGVHLSVNTVVRIAAETLGRTATTVSVPDRLIQDRCYAMGTGALNELGWKAAVPPVEAIRRAVLAAAEAVSRPG